MDVLVHIPMSALALSLKFEILTDHCASAEVIVAVASTIDW